MPVIRIHGIKSVVARLRQMRLVAITCLCAVLVVAGCAATPKAKVLTDEQRQLNLESFDYVWTTIRDKHYDPDLMGLDWQAIRDELRPRVAQATSMTEARAPMNEMLSRLKQSHFAIIPAEVYENMSQPGEKGTWGGVTGIDARVIDGHALVTSVAEGSPAAEAGVQPGWEIVRIGEDEVVPKLKLLAQEFEDSTYKDAVLSGAVKSRLSGPIGDTVTVTFLDADDREVTSELALVEQNGRRYQFGYLPPFYVRIDAHPVDGNIGYITFNCFFDPANVMPAFNDAMKGFMDADGIIIDIRGNPGGIGAMAMGMAGWLIPDKNRYLGTIYTRGNELKLILNPRIKTYDGPVAVLVDGLSGSSSEFFSGGLQDLGRACIVGSRTPGAALPSAIEKLPDGDGFQYVIANYVSADGEALEGAGVIPDIEVRHTREALLAGRDLVLEAAINWIKGQ